MNLRKIRQLEEAIAVVAEYCPQCTRDNEYLNDAFSLVCSELRCRLRDLEQDDIRSIEQKLREKYE